MRMRSLIAIVTLLSPAASNAQRIPLSIPHRGPGRPADLPPQPGPIAREAAYRRWRLAVESYPMVSYFSQSGSPSTWTSFGTGTRADYLVTRNLSATLDMTSSFLGGPMITNTVELGTRLHPEWAEHSLYPFVDLRVGYIADYARGLGAYDDVFNNSPTPTPIARYSRGFGVIGGVGLEYAITRSWSVTTSGSVMQSAMSARDFNAPPAHPNFTMTSLRYTIGVRYNPVRYFRGPGTDIR